MYTVELLSIILAILNGIHSLPSYIDCSFSPDLRAIERLFSITEIVCSVIYNQESQSINTSVHTSEDA